jgi:PAS domain S-box-containing protein
MFADLRIEDLAKYFYKLAELSQDVFWIKSIDLKQLYVSPAYEVIWGSTCQSLYESPESWIDFVVVNDRKKILSEFHKPPVRGTSSVLDYRIMRADHQIRWIHEVFFPIFDANQECIGFAGIAKDNTSEKEKIAELEEASRFFKFFAEKIQSVFWVRDTKMNRQLYLSPAYEKIWGRPREHLYQDPDSWIDTLVPEDRDGPHAAETLVKESEKNESDTHAEKRYRIKRPDGEIRWIKDTSFPIYDDKKEFLGFAGIAEDITKYVLHDQELQEAKERAETANQAKANFLAMMSHELRTPLNAVLGMAQIMRMKKPSKEFDDCVSVILEAGNGLLSLVNDILDFAKLEVGKLSFSIEPLNLLTLSSQVVDGLVHQAKLKNITLDFNYPEHFPTQVMGDAKRIKQILINLLGNAIKFTEQGKVELNFSCVKKTTRNVTFCISVSDSGIGIDKNKLDFIFEKFSQIDSSYQRRHQGTGLGLAITKELVEKMGGNIEVQSELGKGSNFSVTLTFPLHNHIVHLPDFTKRYEKQEDKIQLRTLLVEDNSINQRIAKIMLEDVGCEVHVMDCGKQVLDKINELHEYDVIFIDIGLPDLTGFEVTSVIRKEKKLKNIPIIAMTAHILERDRQYCYEVGMNRILMKPISHEELIGVLKSIIGTTCEL